MTSIIETSRERSSTFADELAYSKIKPILQALRQGRHFSVPYPQIEELWAKAFLKLAADIRAAGRLRLTDPLLAMVQQVSANWPSSLLQALPLCRLPYQNTWIEWDAGERRAGTSLFAKNGLPMPEHEGILLVAIEPTLRRFCAISVWKHQNSDIPQMPSLVA